VSTAIDNPTGKARGDVAASAIAPGAKSVELWDVARGKVTTERYDKLVLALGAISIRLPLPGIELPGIFEVRAVPDARAIRKPSPAAGAVAARGTGRRQNEAQAQQQQQGAQQEQQQKMVTFYKAYGACMEGCGQSVKQHESRRVGDDVVVGLRSISKLTDQ
jgi:NAD(P)H-nitrite reductase large subunit